MWIARDKNGTLQICNSKPIRVTDKSSFGYWDYPDNDCNGILEIADKTLYPYLTWADEPLEVELWTKKYWKQTIDDIIHKYISKQESGEFGSVIEIVNDITKELCN